MTTSLSPASSSSCFWLDAFQAPRTRFLITNAAFLLTIKFGIEGFFFNALCVLLAWGHVYPHQLLRMSRSAERFLNRRRWSPIGSMTLLLCAVVAVIALVGHTEPASAQFFNQTETWMKSTLGKGAAGSGGNVADMIALTFNVLRGLFVIYLGISLVKVIQNARDGEDWQTLAKTPLIILVTVTLGDVLGGLITGGGSGSAKA
ncbi:hypothetical protein H6F86_05685 [Phormidium sp. FACHB-592]|uniref:Uncharacterized protein n=1 Tax=Stenomitos frigidus AS-A4 TaxID=2933935 RepID=A0ABV0KRX3_9CYAN|nr:MULTISPECIES: hypothetical protein [Cyanophyceae]MBD2033535.1 hypothetical protein [Leptolyngbya sp. FACHB-321]MBD2073383.1 hypothetical protein [Phormidium sp. FACHB-592]